MGETRVAYQNATAAPRLIHFVERLARRACVGLVAHVTHAGDAAEIPRGALAGHLHKIYLQEMSCTAEGSPINIQSEFECPVYNNKFYFN